MGYTWARAGKAAPYAMRCAGEVINLRGRYVLAVDDGNAYLAAGLGVLWLLDYMSKPHLTSGDLVPLFEGWQHEPMPMYVAFAPNRHVSSKLREFIDWIVELMAVYAPQRSA